MKKIVRLTERDLTKLVKKVIKEDEDSFMDYEEKLNELKSRLNDIENELESRLNDIEEELLQMEEDINNEDNLDDDEKEDLIDYVDELYSRCKPKKKY
jgi:molecular chaperone GrpE (heat shock protein)